MKTTFSLLGVLLLSARVAPPSPSALSCDLRDYKSQPGLTAAIADDLLVVTWKGDRDAEIRARYAIDAGQPVVRDLAVRKASGAWATLGENLAPEYRIVTGVRR